MNIMMYILGSGIMEIPILFNFILFLSIAIVLGLLAWEVFRRSEKAIMVIMTCLLGVAAMICLFVSVYHLAKLMPKEKAFPRVEKMEYENHEYLIFRDKFSIDVVHNPDCACRKIFKPLKDK